MSLADREPVARLPEPAERVRLRTLFGVTQAELAAEMRVTRKAIYAWEHGLAEPTGENRIRYSRLIARWAETERRKAGD
jgi:DNA-binding XRE family transcriptional regulator